MRSVGTRSEPTFICGEEHSFFSGIYLRRGILSYLLENYLILSKRFWLLLYCIFQIEFNLLPIFRLTYINNLEEYISLVVDATIKTRITRQMEAFKAGFNQLSSTAANASSNGNGPSELADDDLPSVMTCANYLILPPYSTKKIMSNKLLYAINEG
ncbi:E3 ubiquitin-protein ligase UPL3-like [Arachis stenosperma]|uniref:E3 ubiquitin-protein ligase UPL3-like n=1 Tax=Arachis stenosperma TaxID=217475 RepID=UPI0025ACE49B|nr:E3 ubiquitin-protein ligase UPL3-like [Arachis stenosperma]XP_057752290.1 E3 ubiquitin-protein ligase UPL3-like [Arachis stenosperma]XP_057752291.1 E3 ubiquitin-protein ligase UPL3-like [Arachis stenosperma]XP_057752292.1 E3 ubiquitin-protein ligase UPL3-like [Arachis stenosperma]